MITCKLGDKTYTVDYVTGRALREIEPAAKMYTRISAMSEAAVKGETLDNPDGLTIPDAMDVLIRWFCLLFNNQFTPDDMYDYYPADRIMHDISTAIIAVQAQTTDVLSEFPTNPAAEKKPKARA